MADKRSNPVDTTGRLADGDQTPARVLAIAEQIGDQAIAWRECENGNIVIVFNMKGKQTFDKGFEIVKPEKVFAPIIHTKEEAQEAVETLPPAHTPQPKKKGKP
jgi:hypothetical protein